MRPRRAPPAPLMLTRRALANSLVAGAAVVGLPVRPVQAMPAGRRLRAAARGYGKRDRIDDVGIACLGPIQRE